MRYILFYISLTSNKWLFQCIHFRITKISPTHIIIIHAKPKKKNFENKNLLEYNVECRIIPVQKVLTLS